MHFTISRMRATFDGVAWTKKQLAKRFGKKRNEQIKMMQPVTLGGASKAFVESPGCFSVTSSARTDSETIRTPVGSQTMSSFQVASRTCRNCQRIYLVNSSKVEHYCSLDCKSACRVRYQHHGQFAIL